MSYKYGVIDFELINRRNCCAIKKDELTVHSLLRTNVLSIFKLIDQYNFDIPILLFDCKPYFKSKYIDEYKKDRKRYTKESLDELNKNDENYEKEKLKIEYEIHKGDISKEAKKYMIDSWNHFCIPMIYEGLEADDISFMISRTIDDKTIHLTKDTDYIYHPYNNHDVAIIKKSGNTLYKYDSILENKVPLEYQKVFNELFKSSHNGINIKKLKLSNDELYDMYVNKKFDEDIITRINGLNPLMYLNESIKSYILNKFKLSNILNPDVNYLKKYKYLSHKRIYEIQRRQSLCLDNLDELL